MKNTYLNIFKMYFLISYCKDTNGLKGAVRQMTQNDVAVFIFLKTANTIQL